MFISVPTWGRWALWPIEKLWQILPATNRASCYAHVVYKDVHAFCA